VKEESDTPTLETRMLEVLRGRYGATGDAAGWVFAPYRICPLGAHIDHQLGEVTAMAIDRGVTLAFVASSHREVRLISLEYAGEVQFSLDEPGAPRGGEWGNYARGAVCALMRAGYRLSRGLLGVISGPWSEGGLSSSAAAGIAYLLALEAVNDLRITPEQNIALDQSIENGYLGLHNGILDPAGILYSRRDHLTLVDCATARHRLIPAPPAAPAYGVLLAFSGVKQSLISTDYNRRVTECQAAARMLLQAAGRTVEAPWLSHLTELEYERHRDRLPTPLDRRAAHFFGETSRVRSGVAAWERGDLVEFGRLMTASGESSIRNYECGCPPLIDLYEILVSCPGVYGARFSGAGFRGCCLALVDRGRAAEVAERIGREYAERQPALASGGAVEWVESGDGARVQGRMGSR